MDSYKFIRLTGVVHWRGTPQRLPGKHFKSAYFTLKCTTQKMNNKGEYEETEDFFTIHTYKENQIIQMREGYIISCLVRRDGKLWLKNGEMQFKDDRRTFDNETVFYGKYPIVFDSYHLIGEIEVINSKNNLERIRQNNEDFESNTLF